MSLTQQTEVPGVKGHVEIFWHSDTVAQNKPKIMSTRELWVGRGSRRVLERLRTGVTDSNSFWFQPGLFPMIPQQESNPIGFSPPYVYGETYRHTHTHLSR